MLIYEKLSAVMAEVGAIGKDQVNQFDRYSFRGIDDVYNAVQPALVKHGVIVAPEVLECTIDSFMTTKGTEQQRTVVKVAHHFFASDGSSVVVTTMGEGADRGDKSVNKAHSSAYKTAFFQALCIPTEEKSDSEHDSPDLSGAQRQPRRETHSSGPQRGGTISEKQKKLLFARAKVRIEQLGDESLTAKDIIEGAKQVGKLESIMDLQSSQVDRLLQWIDAWEPGGAA